MLGAYHYSPGQDSAPVPGITRGGTLPRFALAPPAACMPITRPRPTKAGLLHAHSLPCRMTILDFNQLSHEVQLAYTYRAGTYVARRWDDVH